MNGVEIWDQINESVQVLAWPAVVGAAIWIFRVKLGSLFSRVREADTPAGKITFDPAEAKEAEAEVRDSASKLLEEYTAGVLAAQVASGHLDDREVGQDVEPMGDRGVKDTAPLDMTAIKEDVEAVIRSSFDWGFQAARAQGNEFKVGHSPTPMISWEDRTPSITGWGWTGEDLLDSSAELPAPERLQYQLEIKRLTETRDVLRRRFDRAARERDMVKLKVVGDELAMLQKQLARLEQLDRDAAIRLVGEPEAG